MTEKIELVVENLGEAPVKKGKRWLVTIATPGQGSSGYYSEEVLREYGPLAFPAGTKSFFNHDDKRDVRDMVGIFKRGAFWNDETGRLQGYLTPFPQYAAVLEGAVDDETGESYVEASVHVESVKDTRTGRVLRLNPNRANTVDLVGFGGLEGSRLEMLVESFAAASAISEDTGKDTQNVEITKEMWEALNGQITTLGTTLSTFINESKTAIKGEADAEALAEAVTSQVKEALAEYAVQEKAIDDADILATQKESLKARARDGEDITADLATAVEFVKEAKKEFAPAATPNRFNRGTVVVATESLNGKSDAPKTFTPSAWSKN